MMFAAGKNAQERNIQALATLPSGLASSVLRCVTRPHLEHFSLIFPMSLRRSVYAGSPPSLRDRDLLRPHRSPYCPRARSSGKSTEKCSIAKRRMSHTASGDDAVSNQSRLAISSIKAPAKQQIHSIHRACVRNDRPAAPELPGDFENMRAAAQPFLITENKVPVERFGKRDHLRIGQSDLALAD